MLSKTAQRLLLRAAKLIGQEHRWIKGQYIKSTHREEDRFCAIGAVMTAAREMGIERYSSEYMSAFTEVNDALCKNGRISRAGFETIPAFNDHHDTTYADVKQLFCDTVKQEVTDDSILDDDPKGGDRPDPARLPD